MASVLLLIPSAVFAHADLVASTPADGATVSGTPPLIVLTFTEVLTANSSLELIGPVGSIVSGSPPVPSEPATMTIDPPNLEPGEYSVRWTAATDDGYIERGAITFTVVAPPPPTPTPSPTPSAIAEPTPTPAPTQTAVPASPSPTPAPAEPVGGDGPDLTVLLAVGVVAILLGFAARVLLPGGRAR